MPEKDWYIKLLQWRERHIKPSTLLLLLSLVTGFLTSLAALLLKFLIEQLHNFVTFSISAGHHHYYYLIFPAIGIMLAALFVKHVVRDDIAHGITKILYAISQRKGRIKPHNTWSSIVASSVTIGLGGSVGAEAPIVLTGSAIGSTIGNFFKLSQKDLMILIGCGAAGAIAGIFKAPIAGLLFAIEVLMLDFTSAAMMPMLLSSITAATLTYVVSGTQATFSFDSSNIFSLVNIPWVILLGICCGFASLYIIRGMGIFEGWFKRRKQWVKILAGAGVLSILIFFFPPLYGEGYDSIEALINDRPMTLLEGSLFFRHAGKFGVIIIYFLLIIFTKVLATASTNGAGGVGGVFAPTLFIGAFTGFIIASLLNHFGIATVSNGNFALMGMAGLMSGVMHAPMTGIFLIAELTGGYSLFLPLMITSLISLITIRAFERHSIYSWRLAQKGELLTHHKDKAVLTLLKMENVIEDDFDKVYPEMLLGTLVKVISRARRNSFPVVDRKDGTFVGVVLLDDIRNIMFRSELYDRFTVRRIMSSPPAVLHVHDSMEQVMTTFDRTNAWNLPVVDENGRYVGFVSKSKIFNSYRKVLVHFSDE